MTISRRDTIILGVLVNLGLIAILFMTALRSDDEEPINEIALNETIAETPVSTETLQLSAEPATPVDVVDTVLNQYSSVSTSDNSTDASETNTQATTTETAPIHGNTTEITVKRGDSLDKIARANGTTADQLKKLNHLSTDKLSIGQVIKVPAGKPALKKTESPAKEIASGEAVYYTIKSGDSPWKIAKAQKVAYEDILKLNNLTEEKAKNLKIGDQIRIK